VKLRTAHIGLGLVVLATLVSAFGVVYAKHENRKLFITLQVLQAERDAMNVEWGQLQLEQSTQATHARVDVEARGRLGMQSPDPKAIIIIRPVLNPSEGSISHGSHGP
jgi:cell division protein FtsL